MTDGCAILCAPLQKVKAEYSTRPPTAVDGWTLARRAGHFASALQFGLDQPAAMHKASSHLANSHELEGLLVGVLDTAIALTGADFGNVQLVEPVTGALYIVAQSGFDTEFLDYFAVVDDATSACGQAAKTGGQVVVADTLFDPSFAPHRAVAEASHVRAVQSTPLFTHSGELIGMVSTHFQRPHRPSDRDLRIIRLFSDVASDAIASRLGAPDDLGPIRRALVTALLAPMSLSSDNPIGPADRLSAPLAVDANVKSVSALLRDRFGLGS